MEEFYGDNEKFLLLFEIMENKNFRLKPTKQAHSFHL